MKTPIYSDYKIGEKIFCCKLHRKENEERDKRENSNNYYKNLDIKFYEEHLTVGKSYKIKDLDFHFPDSVCVKSDNKRTGFYPIEFFVDDLIMLRKKKINRII
jgi:hypothetical protein